MGYTINSEQEMQLLNNNTEKKDLKYYYEMSKVNKNKKLNIKFSLVSL